MKTAKVQAQQTRDELNDGLRYDPILVSGKSLLELRSAEIQLDVLQSLRSRLTDPASIAVVDKMIEEAEL